MGLSNILRSAAGRLAGGSGTTGRGAGTGRSTYGRGMGRSTYGRGAGGRSGSGGVGRIVRSILNRR